MSHGGARRPCNCITRKEQCFFIFDEYKLACDHKDKLILCLMPVAMRGSGARRQLFEVDTELR